MRHGRDIDNTDTWPALPVSWHASRFSAGSFRRFRGSGPDDNALHSHPRRVLMTMEFDRPQRKLCVATEG
jgi:hypothetical protein